MTHAGESTSPIVHHVDKLDVRKDLSPKDAIVSFATNLGFDYVGVTSVESLKRGMTAQDRVRDGFMRGLNWFTEERVIKASSPKQLLPEARSILSLAVSYYYPLRSSEPLELHGKIARYAWSQDYLVVYKS